MRRFWLALLLIALLVGCAPPPKPVVRAVLFWADYCPHCHLVINETLPAIQQQYGEQFELFTIEIESDADRDLQRLVALTLGVPEEYIVVPMVIVGNRAIIGSKYIPSGLPLAIKEGLANGGVDLPDIPALLERIEQGGAVRYVPQAAAATLTPCADDGDACPLPGSTTPVP